MPFRLFSAVTSIRIHRVACATTLRWLQSANVGKNFFCEKVYHPSDFFKRHSSDVNLCDEPVHPGQLMK